jgi:hypothetical protein
MADKCTQKHTLVSDLEAVTNKQGKVEIKLGDFPDMVIGNGDDKDAAKKDAKKKAKEAAATFCATKKCAAGKGCIWKDMDSKFDVVDEYMTEGMGWFAVLRIKSIECKCK